MTKLNSYLLFDGTCKPAVEFYQSVFGGELQMTMLGDSPMRNMFPSQFHSRIVNARLVSDLVDISASDWLAANEAPVRGNMMCMYLNGGNAGALKQFFEMLSVRGKVTDPLQSQPFGLYGALNDQFGVRWMFHTDNGN